MSELTEIRHQGSADTYCAPHSGRTAGDQPIFRQLQILRRTRKYTSRPVRAFLALVWALCLALPASAQSIAGESFSGNYLAAQSAANAGDYKAAAQYYSNALAHTPGDLDLLNEALAYQLADGNFAGAAILVPQMLALEEDNLIAHLTQIAAAVKTGRLPDILAELPDTGWWRFEPDFRYILDAWTHFDQGNTDAALQSLSTNPSNDYFVIHRAMIWAAAGDPAQAAQELLALNRRRPLGTLHVVMLADLLFLAGKQEAARQALNRVPGDIIETVMLASANRALARGDAPGLLTFDLRGAMTLVFLYHGIALLYEGHMLDAAIDLQFAHYLSPENDTATYLLGTFFKINQQYDEAAVILDRIGRRSDFWSPARAALAEIAFEDDRVDHAIDALRALLREDASDTVAIDALGSIFWITKRFAEAEQIYGDAISRIGEAESHHWSLFFQRGIAHERQGNWDAAERDFRTSLALSPDQPLVLNYLGYGLADQNLRLDEALELVQRASQLQPSDWSIIDSLGWTYYRLGDYENAARILEQAISLKPDDPIINDHLGDAYWHLGLHRDARFQWTHALNFDPEPEELGKIRRKLANGLPAPSSN